MIIAGIRALRGLRLAVLGAFAASAAAAPLAEDIRDIRGPRNLLPDWVAPALAVFVVLLGVGLYGLWRWRRTRRVRVLLPHELALEHLDEIRALMGTTASAREFCTASSDIIRRYIEQRFNVTATRQTTEEFLRDLLESSNKSLAQHQALLEDFLHQCDFAKFAALSLTLNDMESLRQSARRFVLETAEVQRRGSAQAHDSVPAT